MKITCESCGSKYSIADEKVRGKRVKVRCKNCKTSILVDAKKAEEAEDAPSESEAVVAAPAEPAAAALETEKPSGTPPGSWSVNFSDDDSRDMTTKEIVAGWKDGTVTSDAYVWKDGMGDWKPVLEIPELAAKLQSSALGDGVTTSAAARPAARISSTGANMDDLFGGIDSAGANTDQSAGPAPALPDADQGKPTGARNDSSVLFSLDALKAGVEPQTQQSPPSRSADDPFGIGGVGGFGGMGGGGLGGAGTAELLTAPAKAPPKPVVQPVTANAIARSASNGGKRKIAIAAAAVVLLGLGGAAFAFMGGGVDEDQAASTKAAQAEDAEAEKKAEEEKKALEEKLAKAEAERKAAEEKAKEALADKKEAEEKAAEKAEEEKKEEETSEADAAPGTDAPKPSGGSSAPDPKPASKPPFNKSAAVAALSSAAANAGSCKKPGGPTGSGKVQLTFNPSGRATGATVTSGPLRGTSVGGCVASVFRRATIPAFSGSPVTVSKSFSVR